MFYCRVIPIPLFRVFRTIRGKLFHPHVRTSVTRSSTGKSAVTLPCPEDENQEWFSFSFLSRASTVARIASLAPLPEGPWTVAV